MKITRLPCPLWCISLRQSLGCGWLLLIMSHRYDPPTGIALAVILIFGYRYWPSILIGALAVFASTDVPLKTALGIGVGNTLEALRRGGLGQRCRAQARGTRAPAGWSRGRSLHDHKRSDVATQHVQQERGIFTIHKC